MPHDAAMADGGLQAQDPPLDLLADDASSLLTRYLRDVRRISLLSHQRERTLAQQIHEGRARWHRELQHHLVHVPLLLACRIRLRRGLMSMADVFQPGHVPAWDDGIATPNHRQQLCGRMRQLIRRQRHQEMAVEAAHPITALRATIHTLLLQWAWRSELLNQAWTGFDAAMMTSSSRHARHATRFVVTLGYRLDELRELWRSLHVLHVSVEHAKQEMIRRNVRRVMTVAREFRDANLPLNDLLQEGNMGLIRAVEKFDYRRCVKFSTHAVWWIRQAMRRAIVQQSTLIRIPEYLYDSIQQVHKALSVLPAALNRSPTVPDSAQHLGMPLERVEWSLAFKPEHISLDQPLEDAESRTLGERLTAPEVMSDQADLEQQDVSDRIERALDGLAPREAVIICRRFGLYDHPRETLRQIGSDLRISQERVRQIEAQALSKPQHYATGQW